MGLQNRPIEYRDGATVLEGRLVWDDSFEGTRPGVLVSHAWSGRSDYEDGKADALARLGYAAFALDLYGKGVRGRDPDENAALMPQSGSASAACAFWTSRAAAPNSPASSVFTACCRRRTTRRETARRRECWCCTAGTIRWRRPTPFRASQRS